MQRLGACANSLIVKMVCISCALKQPARAQKAAVDCVPSDYLSCIPAIVRIRARSRCLHLCAPLIHAALLPCTDLSPAKVNSMEDEPLWANIDVIVEAHASGTGAEPPHSYAFTRCITKKVLRRTHDHVLELINNGTVARGTLLVTMARVVLIILGVRPPTEPWADADACA